MRNDKLFWNMNYDLLDKTPKQVLSDVLSADRDNHERSIDTFQEELSYIDQGLELFIEALQGSHHLKESFEQNSNIRASRAMAVSLINYLLAVRHLLLLGYFPEARSLRRDCHERLTRCVLFAVNDKMAEGFLSGKKIEQHEVDKRLSKFFDDNEDSEKGLIHKALRNHYRKYSKSVHPEIGSFNQRLFPPARSNDELKSRVGTEEVIGGFISEDVGKALLASFMELIITSLWALRSFITEESGGWNADYDALYVAYNRMMERYKDRSSDLPESSL